MNIITVTFKMNIYMYKGTIKLLIITWIAMFKSE